MKAFSIKTVHGGKDLSSAGIEKRFREIATNKKSAYHKAYLDGRLQVHYHASKRRPDYSLVVVSEGKMPFGTSICGDCGKEFFRLDDDYLCGKCRNEI